MEISTQDYGYSSSKTTSTKTMESLEDKYGEKFDDYLKKFEELSADGVITEDEAFKLRANKLQAVTEITDAINANGGDIQAEIKFYGWFANYPEDIANQLEGLENKFMETKDAKYKFMQTEIAMQYNAYQNGEDIDSMFVVGKDGQLFNWSENQSTMTNNKDVDAQKFVDKMLDIFIEKLGNSSGDLKDKYQDLVDNYQQMKDQIETNKTNSYRGSSFYA
jgi:hypothetical protein